MPRLEDLLDFLAAQGVPDEWTPAETIEAGGGTIPKTSSKGLVRAQDDTILEVGPFSRIMAQYAMRDRAALRASLMGAFALQMAKGALDGLRDLRLRGLQTGRTYLPRKYVVRGLEVSVGSGRSLSIAAGVAVQGGLRRSYPERPNAIAVPTNPGSTPKTYTLYLTNDGAPYLVEGTSPPEGGLALARVSVPAGDTGPAFGGTITDVRLIATPSSFIPPTLPSLFVPLEYPMPDAHYTVFLHVESASDLGRVALVVTEKARNGFRITNMGTADDIVVRWLALEPDWR